MKVASDCRLPDDRNHRRPFSLLAVEIYGRQPLNRGTGHGGRGEGVGTMAQFGEGGMVPVGGPQTARDETRNITRQTKLNRSKGAKGEDTF